MLKNQLITPEGTKDFLFEEAAVREEVETLLHTLFKARGFSEVITPGLEFLDVFSVKGHSIPVEYMYKLSDHKGRLMVLRPDSTMPIARLCATRLRAEQLPLRLSYNQTVYSQNRTLTGRSDEVKQAGVELIGKKGADADAEVIALAIGTLLKIGFDGFKIELGQVAYFKGLLAGCGLDDEQTERIRALVDAKNNVELEYELSRLNIDTEKKTALLELGSLFGGPEALERADLLAENDECRAAVENIREVYDILCGFGYEKYISIDFGILNNFNYYSGIIFRGISDGIGTPILSGGRYDELLREFDADAPATGFALGVKELLVVLERQGKLPKLSGKTLVVRTDRKHMAAAFSYVQKLRESGKRALLELSDENNYDPVLFETIDFKKEA